jgi:Ala-tRNA(Pro) deacylase
MPDSTHTTMGATRDDLFARLQELGIETETHEHPPVFTVEEAQAHCSHLPGGHCKNLFLKDKKKRLWLIVTLDEQPIDLNAVSKALGAPRFSFGKAELLAEVLGVIPGAVTPLALINDTDLRVNVVLDAAMMSLDLLNYHPLSNDATTAITPPGLLALLASFGHEPRLFDFATLT